MEEKSRPASVAPRRIARRYHRIFHRQYAVWKLRLDPLYDAVADIIIGRQQPVLDLGCGIGLLAIYLRERGFAKPVHGLDFDRQKIDAARRVAENYPPAPDFSEADILGKWPAHSGTVTLLDVLQYLPESARCGLLARAAECVAPGGALIIRSGMADSSRRHGVTVLIDVLADKFSWMKSGPESYPTRSWLEQTLAASGMTLAGGHALTGPIPFNNSLFVFTRE